jgi:flavoprotein
MYGVLDRVQRISTRIFVNKLASAPEVGGLARGRYKVVVISPATANTVAKIVVGIADTVVTNAVAQAQKAGTPIIVVPTDQVIGPLQTWLPDEENEHNGGTLDRAKYGERIQISIRKIDAENVDRLKRMDGMTVLDHPYKIRDVIKSYLE